MKPESQYWTEKQGEQLVKFGIDKCLSHAYWYRGIFYFYPKEFAELNHLKPWQEPQQMFQVNGVMPAFSVAEIIAMLPDLEVVRYKIDDYIASIESNESKIGKKLAETLCEVLIKSLKDKRISFEVCNKQLHNS